MGMDVDVVCAGCKIKKVDHVGKSVFWPIWLFDRFYSEAGDTATSDVPCSESRLMDPVVLC
jgi:hypothetical protein